MADTTAAVHPPATPGGESAAAADGLDELTARLSEIKVTVVRELRQAEAAS